MSKIIYTSSFSRIGKLTGVNIISISRGDPKGININKKIHKLTPSWDLIESFKKTKDIDMYTHRYYEEVLANCNLGNILDGIPDGSLLACYCQGAPFEDYTTSLLNPLTFCHRFIIAKEGTEKHGISFIEI